jgi:minor extracellular protease Epr
MKNHTTLILRWTCLLALTAGPAQSQQLPGIPAGGQSVLERQLQVQAERQAQRAIERTAEQAAGRVVERSAEQASERVVGRSAEQTAERALDRAATQAAQRALNAGTAQATERAAAQALQQTEQVQRRALHATQSLPAHAIERVSPATDQRPDVADLTRPSTDLPSRIPVNDQAGNRLFVDIEITPNVRAIEGEWVMLLDASQRQQLEDQAPALMRFLIQTRPFEALDGYLLRFSVPPDLDADEAILDLVPDALHNLIDRNHVYSAQSAPLTGLDKLPLSMLPVCTDNLGIGVIDSAVNTSHPAFHSNESRQQIVQREFVEEDVISLAGHGTAVVSVMVGQGPDLTPLLPGATVYSAAVAHTRDEAQESVSVMNLLSALGWLATEDLTVINMSLSGPDNRLLAQAVNIARARGKILVAAAGNDGPHAPPRYPAAYEGVLTATAVDRDGRIYRWANQGKHVDFAALGVSVPVALADGSFGQQSGTSLAAPVVSAFVACALSANGNSPQQALAQLKQQAVDLGESGHDPVFGHGLLHPRHQ